MPSNTDSLLTVLNTTNLQKDNPRLYQVLQAIVINLLKNEQVTAATAAAMPSGGGVSGSGVAGQIAEWNNTTSLTVVDVAGISAALDLI